MPISPHEDTENTDINDRLNITGVYGALTVGTSAVELKVGGSVHSNRKSATLHNNGTVAVYWGYNNSVTTSTGTPIQPGQLFTWSIGPSISIWLISGTASQNTRITETS